MSVIMKLSGIVHRFQSETLKLLSHWLPFYLVPVGVSVTVWRAFVYASNCVSQSTLLVLQFIFNSATELLLYSFCVYFSACLVDFLRVAACYVVLNCRVTLYVHCSFPS